jgi:competence protein ComEC
MQTLFLTVALLLALFPTLLFEIGFWLSVLGVFYIFLYLIHFKEYNRYITLITLSIWVYLMMLPYSLALFGNFSLYHPLSVLLSIAFTLFYPLSIFLHLIGFGNIFDGYLDTLLTLEIHPVTLHISYPLLLLFLLLSLWSIKNRYALYTMIISATLLFGYAVFHIL